MPHSICYSDFVYKTCVRVILGFQRACKYTFRNSTPMHKGRLMSRARTGRSVFAYAILIWPSFSVKNQPHLEYASPPPHLQPSSTTHDLTNERNIDTVYIMQSKLTSHGLSSDSSAIVKRRCSPSFRHIQIMDKLHCS